MHFEPTFHTRSGDPTGSLCQSCQKAVPHSECRCSWSDHFEPVDGWTAIPTRIIESNDGDEDSFASFCVTDCPEFLDDEPRDWRQEEDEEELEEQSDFEPADEVPHTVSREESQRERIARKSDPGLPYCKYSLAVLCNRGPDDDCWVCGWNPEVDGERRKNLRKESA